MIVTETSTSRTYISHTEFLKRQHKGAHWGGGAFTRRILGAPDGYVPTPGAETARHGVSVYLLDRVIEAEQSGALAACCRSTSPIAPHTLEWRRRAPQEEIAVHRVYAEQGAWLQGQHVLSESMRAALALLAAGDVEVDERGAVAVRLGTTRQTLHASTVRALVRRGYVEEGTYSLTEAGK